MNIRLHGERYTQRSIGTPLHPEYEKVKRSFICVAEGGSLRELTGDEDIHLKYKDYVNCMACGEHQPVMIHFGHEDHEKWLAHPRRCNYAYIP